MQYDVTAFDGTLTGAVTDEIVDSTYTAGIGVTPRYVVADEAPLTAPAGGNTRLTVQATGSPAPSSQTGLLILQSADALDDFQTVAVTADAPALPPAP